MNVSASRKYKLFEYIFPCDLTYNKVRKHAQGENNKSWTKLEALSLLTSYGIQLFVIAQGVLLCNVKFVGFLFFLVLKNIISDFDYLFRARWEQVIALSCLVPITIYKLNDQSYKNYVSHGYNLSLELELNVNVPKSCLPFIFVSLYFKWTYYLGVI